MALQFPLVAVLLLLLSVASRMKTAAAAVALPDCPEMCGNLTIPYPFGLTEKCSLGEKYYIKCSNTTQPPTAYLMNSELIVTNISFDLGELEMLGFVATDCYNAQGSYTTRLKSWLNLPLPYTISDTKNRFIAVGCDTHATIEGLRGEGDQFGTGCVSKCNKLSSVDNNSCSGVGCCQTEIPKEMYNSTISLLSYNYHKGIWGFNPCSYGFIVEQGKFNFSSASFEQVNLNDTTRPPMVLNWAIGYRTFSCDDAKLLDNYACKRNSDCITRPNNGAVGYLCQCLPGYEGNPYHPDGCQDIDDCKALNPCKNGKCQNTPLGNYTCSCDDGYKNDPLDRTSCIKDDSIQNSKMVVLLTVSLGVTMGILVLFLGTSWICWGRKKRELIKLKEKHFKENGGFLLLQQLASHGSSMKTTKIFTAQELEEATNNYHESRVLGEGGYGTVYKGILPDEVAVAIKKSKGGTLTQSDQFVNEVILLSQINHRNVVRLLGCCLETEVPLLVYEFITHGTLHEHIHKKRSDLSFELRLKIAVETAEALAHLHSSMSNPIIHRDVKAANILLDDDYTAKVSDFGASRLVPSGQTEVQTLVLGTFGYLDPEYLQSNQLTEKSDVYSFGVVLVELLTSKVPVSKDRCLASIFVASMEADWLDQILDDEILNEGNIVTVKKVAKLAKRSLRVKGEERPTMKEVAKELEEMIVRPKHPWESNANLRGEDTEYLLGSLNSDAYIVAVGEDDCSALIGGTSTAYDSMQIEQLTPHDGGR